MEKRLYGLFEVETLSSGRKRYHRIGELAFPKEQAIRCFQSALLAYAFGQCDKPRELRPLPKQAPCG